MVCILGIEGSKFIFS